MTRGNTTQLQVAFIQLVQNARAAMSAAGPGGRPGHPPTFETSAIAELLTRVMMRDSRWSINAEQVPHIFDPIFSTNAGDWSGLNKGCNDPGAE